MPARRHVSELPKVPPMRVPWGSADLSYWRSAHPATVHGLRVRGVVYYISWCASRERLEGNFKAYWGQVWDIWGPFWVSWGPRGGSAWPHWGLQKSHIARGSGSSAQLKRENERERESSGMGGRDIGNLGRLRAVHGVPVVEGHGGDRLRMIVHHAVWGLAIDIVQPVSTWLDLDVLAILELIVCQFRVGRHLVGVVGLGCNLRRGDIGRSSSRPFEGRDRTRRVCCWALHRRRGGPFSPAHFSFFLSVFSAIVLCAIFSVLSIISVVSIALPFDLLLVLLIIFVVIIGGTADLRSLRSGGLSSNVTGIGCRWFATFCRESPRSLGVT